jgi:RNA polymerase sigma factor (sigma-70 family)
VNPLNSVRPAEELFAHARWLRGLALAMAGAADVADDAVQETWEAVLRNAPDPDRPPKPWLAQILKNFVRKRHRSQRRRAENEQRASLEIEYVAEGSDAVAERAESHRLLADFVSQLDETHKTVILLRYYDEKTSTEIASQLGKPEGTIRRQLKEAREILATKMDGSHAGNRRRWLGAFAPAGALPTWQAHGSQAIGTSMVSLKTIVGVAGLASIAAAVFFISRSSETVPSVSSQNSPRLNGVPSYGQMSSTDGGDLTVTAFDHDGKALPGTTLVVNCIKACTPENTASRRERTGPDGSAKLTALPIATYKILAFHPVAGNARLEIGTMPGSTNARLQLVQAIGAFTLSGMVTDEGGGAVSGSLITMGSRGAGQSALTVSDDKGHFQIATDPGEYTVSAAADGYAAQSLSLSITSDVQHDFKLTPAARIVGRIVRDTDRTPVEGATVAIGREHYSLYWVTDADGRFTATELPSDSYQVSARHGFGAGIGPPMRAVAPGETCDVGDIVLHSTPTIRGTVVDSGGKPIVDADLCIRKLPHDDNVMLVDGPKTTQTNANGQFEIAAMPPARYVVRAGKDGYSWAMHVVSLAAEDVELTFKLETEVRVTGQVLDHDDRPMANARVELQTKTDRGMDAPFTGMSYRNTDSNGRFDADQLGPGWLSVYAEFPGKGGIEVERSPIARGEKRDIVVRFPKGATVSGTVKWDDGEPVAKAFVQWHGRRAAVSTLSDAQGRFTIGPVMPGGCLLQATKADTGSFSVFTLERPDNKRLELKDDSHTRQIELTLARENKSISGTVLDPDGAPISGVSVSAHVGGLAMMGFRPAEHAATDSDGNFQISGLKTGDYAIAADAPGFPRAKAPNVRAPAKNVILRLQTPAVIDGQVVDSNGTPVAKFEVGSQPTVESVLENMIFGRTHRFAPIVHHEGLFRIENLAPGNYDVMVRLAGGRIAIQNSVAVSAGETRRVRLVMQTSATITGRLIDSSTGKPIKGIGFGVSGREGLVHAHSDEEGRFTLKDIFPGRPTFVDVRAYEDFLGEHLALTVPESESRLDIENLELLSIDPKKNYGPTSDVGITIEPGSIGGMIASVADPARAAGIVAGDRVIRIDTRRTDRFGVRSIEYLMWGQPGTDVSVEIRSRSGDVRRHTFTRIPPDRIR